MKRHYTILCAALILLLFTSTAFSALSTPAGLSPGDHFHWVFVTSTSRDATSSDIADYNTFVNSAADAATLTLSGVETGGGPVTALGDINWFAIASTETVDARDNIGNPTSSIYRLDGAQVAADENALWNTDSVDLLAPISMDETLASTLNSTETLEDDIRVWTDTAPIGVRPVTDDPEAANFSPWGLSSQVDDLWIFADTTSRETPYPFYAMSEQLIVSDPQVIPLPGSVVLGLIGLMSSSVALSGRKRGGPVQAHGRDPSRSLRGGV